MISCNNFLIYRSHYSIEALGGGIHVDIFLCDEPTDGYHIIFIILLPLARLKGYRATGNAEKDCLFGR